MDETLTPTLSVEGEGVGEGEVSERKLRKQAHNDRGPKTGDRSAVVGHRSVLSFGG